MRFQKFFGRGLHSQSLLLFMPYLLLLLSVLGSCTEVEDAVHPGAPRMVPREQGLDDLEKGIGPLGDFNALRLQWFRGRDADLSSYVIYRGIDTLRDISQLEFTLLDTHFLYSFNPNISDTEYVDHSVLLGEMHYYFIRARDDAENLSAPGDTVRYRLAVKPFPVSPSGAETVPLPLSFEWKYSADFRYAVDYFIIQVENVTKNQLIWTRGVSRTAYDGSAQSLTYNNDGNALEKDLSALSTYRWRVYASGAVDADGISSEGSLSQWMEFKIKE